MGGAYGHLMHLHEDRDLTFGDLERVFRQAEAGRLDLCTEKTDGMNLVFTWDEVTRSARVARSVGDIKHGGLDAQALASRFADRSSCVAATFASAFDVLNVALSCTLFSSDDRAQVFNGGTTWYSLEVIDSDCPNVINYDKRRSNLVFHAHGSFSVAGPTGAVVQRPEAPGVELLARRLGGNTMNGWFFHGPQAAHVRCTDDGPTDEARAGLEVLLRALDLHASSTVGDFLLAAARQVAVGFRLDGASTEMIALRMASVPGAPSLTQIRGRIPADSYPLVKATVEVEGPALGRILEGIVHRFAVDLLRGLRSTMVRDHEAEVRRIRHEVERAIEAVESRGNDRAKQLLRAQLSRLGSLEGITSSAEGVVFRWDEKVYKLTGNFAPVNQILGLVRYGRGQARVAEEAR